MPVEFENVEREVYETLRRLAAAMLAGEAGAVSLEATGLAHEAYARIARSNPDIGGEEHFRSLAARIMRRVLIDSARARQRRDQVHHEASIMMADGEGAGRDLDVLALHEALEKMAETNPEKAEIVELKYFGGLSLVAIARLRGVSTRTVERGWEFARTWLYRHMLDSREPPIA